jgi:hypothetical protein
MGLDWHPLGKPKPGREAEFDKLYKKILYAFRDPEALWKKLQELAVSPYETLRAPRVGFDADADRWSAERFSKRPEKQLSVSECEWGQMFHGYYVLDLVLPNDGIPIYSNGGAGGYCEAFSFRAQFLKDCRDVLGEDLLGEGWVHHTAVELKDYGTRLRACVASFADRAGVTEVLGRRDRPDWLSDWEHPASKAHIMDSAARWCLFWSERGHGLIADF